MTHSEIITYQGSPKGRTHRIRLRSSIAAWRAIQVFLRDCASEPRPRVLRLDLQKSEGDTTDLDAAIRVLGLPNTGVGAGQTEYNWLLDESSFEVAVNCLDLQRQGRRSAWQPLMQCFCKRPVKAPSLPLICVLARSGSRSLPSSVIAFLAQRRARGAVHRPSSGVSRRLG